MLFYAKECLECVKLCKYLLLLFVCNGRFCCYNHHILVGMGIGNELDNFGLVTKILQEKYPDAVGYEFGLAFHENAVSQYRCHNFVWCSAFHFVANLVLAAWCCNNYLCSCVNTFCKRIVGSCIAGVKSYEHVELVGVVAVNRAFGKV